MLAQEAPEEEALGIRGSGGGDQAGDGYGCGAMAKAYVPVIDQEALTMAAGKALTLAIVNGCSVSFTYQACP